MDAIMFVRWLGAFRKGDGNLLDSIRFEVSSQADRESACEQFKGVSEVHATVGLLVNPKNINKSFKGDCWSEYDGNSLKKTRNPRRARSKHNESWVSGKNSFQGIVLARPLDNYKEFIQEQIKIAHEDLDLPVYFLKEGKRARLVQVL